MKKTQCLAGMLLLQLATFSNAATMIELKDSEGVVQHMYIEGSTVRVDDFDGEKTSAYMLMDTKNKKMFVVDIVKKQVMDMSAMYNMGMNQGAPKTPKLQVSLDKKGGGPKVAGYSTEHFELSVNGQKCADEYLSVEALKALGEKVFEQFVEQFSEDSGQYDNVCDGADREISRLYLKYGFPLKTVNAQGVTESEVLKINTKAALPPGGVDMPSGYEMVDMSKMMPPMPGGASGEMDPAQMPHMH
jgi:hypothetical protein